MVLQWSSQLLFDKLGFKSSLTYNLFFITLLLSVYLSFLSYLSLLLINSHYHKNNVIALHIIPIGTQCCVYKCCVSVQISTETMWIRGQIRLYITQLPIQVRKKHCLTGAEFITGDTEKEDRWEKNGGREKDRSKQRGQKDRRDIGKDNWKQTHRERRNK